MLSTNTNNTADRVQQSNQKFLKNLVCYSLKLPDDWFQVVNKINMLEIVHFDEPGQIVIIII